MGSGLLTTHAPFPSDSGGPAHRLAGWHPTAPGLGAPAWSWALSCSPQMGLSQLRHLPGFGSETRAALGWGWG